MQLIAHTVNLKTACKVFCLWSPEISIFRAACTADDQMYNKRFIFFCTKNRKLKKINALELSRWLRLHALHLYSWCVQWHEDDPWLSNGRYSAVFQMFPVAVYLSRHLFSDTAKWGSQQRKVTCHWNFVAFTAVYIYSPLIVVVGTLIQILMISVLVIGIDRHEFTGLPIQWQNMFSSFH